MPFTERERFEVILQIVYEIKNIDIRILTNNAFCKNKESTELDIFVIQALEIPKIESTTFAYNYTHNSIKIVDFYILSLLLSTTTISNGYYSTYSST